MRSSATLALLPLALAAPAKRALPDCAHAADLTWTFDGPDYRATYLFSTPAHQISNGFVNFNVSNSMLPYDVTCDATSGQLSDFFYGTQIYNCKVPEGNGNDKATFTYASITNQIEFNQTWTCSGADGKTSDLTARQVVGGPDKRTCEESQYQNFNWTQGATYSSRIRTCKGIEFTASPSVEST